MAYRPESPSKKTPMSISEQINTVDDDIQKEIHNIFLKKFSNFNF